MEIRLGGVTGDAEFFLLAEADRVRLGLPKNSLRPTLSRAHHLLKGDIAEKDWKKLLVQGERVWLFDPSPSQLEHPRIADYLKRPLSDGGCDRNRYKVRSREPWYRTRLPRTLDGFMSGMSRHGPWVVFRSMPSLVATNTLYVVRFLCGKNQDERAAWAMWLLTSEAATELSQIGRRYPDGLLKFEPGDISRLSVPRALCTAGAYKAYLHAVDVLIAGNPLESQKLANRWFAPLRDTGAADKKAPALVRVREAREALQRKIATA
jgi:hypothetical protein